MTSPYHLTPASLLQDTEVWLREKERETQIPASQQQTTSNGVSRNSLSKDLGQRLSARLILATFRTSALQASLVNLLCDEPTVLNEQKSKIRALIGVILKQVMQKQMLQLLFDSSIILRNSPPEQNNLFLSTLFPCAHRQAFSFFLLTLHFQPQWCVRESWGE